MPTLMKAIVICAVMVMLISGCAGKGSTQIPEVTSSPVVTVTPVESIATHEETIKGVCDGAIISNAAPYNGGLGPHPIFIVSSSASDQKGWNEEMPNLWLPTSLDTLQLVACLGILKEERIQSCSYFGGPNIERIQLSSDIRLVEALTGKIVFEDVIRGGYPPACPETAPVEMTRQIGAGITPTTIMNFLSPIVENGRLPKVILTGDTGFLRDVSWSPDGTKIATVNEMGQLVLWDTINNVRLNTLQNHDGNAWSVDWSPDGNWLVSGGTGKVVLVNAQSYETRILGDFGANAWVESVNWSLDGNHLFATSRPMTIWDTKTWASESLETENIRHSDSVWSPTGNILAIASGENILRWDNEQKQWLGEFQGDSNTIESLAWSPDGQKLAAGTADNLILIWDVNKEKIVKTLMGHLRAVDSLAWSPDGTRLASAATWDGTVIIWDAVQGTQIISIVFEGAKGLDWSPDGKTLAIGVHRDVVLWMVP